MADDEEVTLLLSGSVLDESAAASAGAPVAWTLDPSAHTIEVAAGIGDPAAVTLGQKKQQQRGRDFGSRKKEEGVLGYGEEWAKRAHPALDLTKASDVKRAKQLWRNVGRDAQDAWIEQFAPKPLPRGPPPKPPVAWLEEERNSVASFALLTREDQMALKLAYKNQRLDLGLNERAPLLLRRPPGRPSNAVAGDAAAASLLEVPSLGQFARRHAHLSGVALRAVAALSDLPTPRGHVNKVVFAVLHSAPEPNIDGAPKKSRGEPPCTLLAFRGTGSSAAIKALVRNDNGDPIPNTTVTKFRGSAALRTWEATEKKKRARKSELLTLVDVCAAAPRAPDFPVTAPAPVLAVALGMGPPGAIA